jgi:hypothetical protein
MSLKITQRRQLNATKSQDVKFGFIDHKNITSLLDVSGEYKLRQNQTLNSFNYVPTMQPVSKNSTFFSGIVAHPVNVPKSTLTNVCVAPTGIARDSALTLISDPVKNAPKTQITLNNNTAISSAVMNKKF